MKAKFRDLDEENNPWNGRTLAFSKDVHGLFESLRSREPFMFELIGENGFTLSVGMAPGFGCVQHAPNDGMPPYLMAVDPARAESDATEMEFVVGGTATPIDGRYRLSVGTVREITTEFINSGKRSACVDWEEF